MASVKPKRAPAAVEKLFDGRAITIRGAREHNLKNVDLTIPRDKLVVFTGLSGSGKSSLAFDTIYAEGQRRYVESLSSYARQFLEMMQKPDVDQIDGLSPAIAIEQKTTSKNPRSTVGTVTEIHDYMRLLWARVGIPYSPATGLPIESQTVSQMVDRVLALPERTRLYLLAPVIRGRKGEYRKEIADFMKRGFQRVKIDGEFYEIADAPTLDKKLKHDIEVVVDRLIVRPDMASRLAESFETALELADGLAIVEFAEAPAEGEAPKQIIFSSKFACPVSGFTIAEIEPRLFSFNNPFGACPACGGLGSHLTVDADLVVPDARLTLRKGAIAPWAKSSSPYYLQTLEALGLHYKFRLDKPWSDLPQKARDVILYGSGSEEVRLAYDDGLRAYEVRKPFEGVIKNLERRYKETESEWSREEIERFMTATPCEACHGYRLKPEALAVKIDGNHIGEISTLSVKAAIHWARELPEKLDAKRNEIAQRILKEIGDRLTFLSDVGLDYLTLSRASGTLSGGESQRIRLASQIGSGLTGVLYVLDEPSIGLHQRDNARLLDTLRRLRELGNTVIVVEHDEDAILAADFVVDIGPGAGVHGGEIIAKGTPEEIKADPNSLTGHYLSGERFVPIPSRRRAATPGRELKIVGARGNNLKNVTASIPLGLFTCVTGVSGGGKSTLTVDTLYKAVARHLNGASDPPAPHDHIEGLQYLDKVIDIDQSPIGRTPRSNPADLYRRLHADPRLVRGAARSQGARLSARALFVQRQGRPLRGVSGRRRHQDRDALSARRLRHLRRLQGQALRPRDAGSALSRQVDRRRARHDRRGSRRPFQGGADDPREDGDAEARRPRLCQSRPAGDDAIGRRSAARQARQGTRAPLDGPHALHPRRADHRPAFPRRRAIARRAARAGRSGQHDGRDRAQSRSRQNRRLDHRHGPRRRRRRRRSGRARHARAGREKPAQPHRGLFARGSGAPAGEEGQGGGGVATGWVVRTRVE